MQLVTLLDDFGAEYFYWNKLLSSKALYYADLKVSLWGWKVTLKFIKN